MALCAIPGASKKRHVFGVSNPSSKPTTRSIETHRKRGRSRVSSECRPTLESATLRFFEVLGRRRNACLSAIIVLRPCPIEVGGAVGFVGLTSVSVALCLFPAGSEAIVEPVAVVHADRGIGAIGASGALGNPTVSAAKGRQALQGTLACVGKRIGTTLGGFGTFRSDANRVGIHWGIVATSEGKEQGRQRKSENTGRLHWWEATTENAQ